MIDHRRRAEAPDQVAIEVGTIDWHLALRVRADTSAAWGFATAVAIAHDVIPIVARVVTRPDPGSGRGRCPGRTLMRAAAAARTQEAVDRAILPVLARGIVVDFRFLLFVGGSDAIDRQQRQRRRAEHQSSDAREEAPARGSLRYATRQIFE